MVTSQFTQCLGPLRWAALVAWLLLGPSPPNGGGLRADELPDQLRLVSWNLEWFYDHDQGDNASELARRLSAPSPEDWQWKLNAVAETIARLRPDILALQEVENRRVLEALTRQLRTEHSLAYRIAFIQGFDGYTEQDVAVLFRHGLVEFSRREQTREMFDSQRFYNLSKHLLARFEWGRGDDRQQLLLLTAHFRSGATQRPVRIRQARLAHHWVQEALAAGHDVVLLGDFNAETDSQETRSDTTIGVLQGLETPRTSDDLVDLHGRLAVEQRATHLTGKQFDRILVSPSLLQDTPGRRDLVFQQIQRPLDGVVRGQPDRDHRDGYYQIPAEHRDTSDHYPLVADFLVR